MRNTTIAIVAFVLAIYGSSFGQQVAMGDDEAKLMAREALAVYLDLVQRTGVPKELSVLDDYKELEFGKPYRVFIVHAAMVDAKSSLEILGRDYGVIWIPVYHSGDPWAELELHFVDGVWIPGRFGVANDLKRLKSLLESTKNEYRTGLMHSAYMVKIPEIGLKAVVIEAEGSRRVFPLSEILVGSSRLPSGGLEEREFLESAREKIKQMRQ